MGPRYIYNSFGSSSELSSFSNKSLDVTTIEQSYIFPHAITSIATTSTKFGVSTKDIIGMSYSELAATQTYGELLTIQWRVKMVRFTPSPAYY